jgi:hypothetical protein
VCLCSAWARPRLEPTIRLPSDRAAGDEADDAVGTRWAVLVAGSNGYYNYRHQVHTRPVQFLSAPFRRSIETDPRSCCVIGLLAAYSIPLFPSRLRNLISFVMS